MTSNNIAYATQCVECLHYRKEISSMQSELLTKDNEIQSVFALYNDLKDIHEMLSKENKSLKEQLNNVIHDKEEIKNKLQHEINRLIDMNSIRNKEHHLQMNSVSMLNEMNLKAKLSAQIESKYIAKLNDKEIEIETLTKKVNELQLDNNKYKCEYDDIKKSSEDEIERLRNKHENDIKDLMNKIEYLNTSVNPTSSVIQSKSLKEGDTDIIEHNELKLQMEIAQTQISSLNSVISALKSEKEELQRNIHLLETKHQNEMNNMNDSYQNIQHKLTLQTQQFTQCESNLKQCKLKLVSLENKFKVLKDENDCLKKENDELVNSIAFYRGNAENLRKQLRSQNKQYANIINEHKQILKQTLNDNETHLNTYKDTIAALTSENDKLMIQHELRDNKGSKELEAAKKNVEMLYEEIQILKKQIRELQKENEILRREHIDKDKEVEYYKNEYGILVKKYKVEKNFYRESKSKVNALDDILRSKNIEINQLNEKLEQMKRDA